MPLTAPVSIPSLLEGDSLNSDEFLRRWEYLADIRHAELIDGIVFMPSPVSLEHGDGQLFLGNWLGFYTMATPGCRSSLEATWLMGDRHVPQPDVTLRVLPEYGGQSGVKGLYASGAPELVIEVAVSSYSRDFGIKKRLYERAGVREYVIVLPGERKLAGFALESGVFRPFGAEVDGVFRSRFFPGLWLDTEALWDLDLPRLNAVVQQGLATPEHAEFAAALAAKRR